MTRRLLAILILLTVACGCMAADATQKPQPVVQRLVGKGQLDKALSSVRTPHRVGAAEASHIGRALLSDKALGTLHYTGRTGRQHFQPRGISHTFEYLHQLQPPDDAAAENDPAYVEGYRNKTLPGNPLKAYVRVEEATGRVLDYTDDEYTCYKNRGKARVQKEDLMTLDQAIRAAERYVHLAGFSLSDMRLTSIHLADWSQHNYYSYQINWNRFVTKKEIGDVEYPATILVDVDAQTGELEMLLFKEYPAAVQPIAPSISKQQAESMALQKCRPKDVVATKTNLMVYRRMDIDDASEPPVLAWHIRFYNKQQPEDCIQDAVIDANSGDVLWALVLGRDDE